MSGSKPRAVCLTTFTDRTVRMPNDQGDPTASWFSLVIRDIQFWVPVAVLAAGLLVLRWIA